MGLKNKDPKEDNSRTLSTSSALRVLILMTALMATTLIIANLAAVKIWNLAGIPVDAGILLFPISYVVGDLLVEVYGKKIANQVAWVGCGMGGLTVVIMFLASMLPDYSGADNVAFQLVVELTGRVFLASIVGFIASQLLNNYIFDKIRERQKTDSFAVRALLSSILAHIPDVLLFEPIAFFGRLSFSEFVEQATFAYAAGVVMETILLFCVTKRLAKYAVAKLKMQNGKLLDKI